MSKVIQLTATNRVAKQIMDIMTSDTFFCRWNWYQAFGNVWVFETDWYHELDRLDDIMDMETVFIDEYGVDLNEFTIM